MIMRITWDQSTGVPADRVVWTWGLNGAAADGPELITLSDLVIASLTEVMATTLTLASRLQGGMQPLLAESFENVGGEAVAVRDLSGEDPIAGATHGPSEVMCVISKVITTPRGESPRGRFYVGPLNSSTTGAGRPSSDTMNTCGQWAVALHNDLVTAGRSPVIVHKAGTPLAEQSNIGSYRVDDAWDTQRRRGWGPTTVNVYTP